PNPTRRSAFSSVRIAGTRTIATPQRAVLPLVRARAFLHARRLALQLAQIIQLRAPYLGRAHHLDLLDRRRVQREDPLDSLAERHFPHRERGARAAAVQPDDHALEDLNAL